MRACVRCGEWFDPTSNRFGSCRWHTTKTCAEKMFGMLKPGEQFRAIQTVPRDPTCQFPLLCWGTGEYMNRTIAHACCGRQLPDNDKNNGCWVGVHSDSEPVPDLASAQSLPTAWEPSSLVGVIAVKRLKEAIDRGDTKTAREEAFVLNAALGAVLGGGGWRYEFQHCGWIADMDIYKHPCVDNEKWRELLLQHARAAEAPFTPAVARANAFSAEVRVTRTWLEYPEVRRGREAEIDAVVAKLRKLESEFGEEARRRQLEGSLARLEELTKERREQFAELQKEVAALEKKVFQTEAEAVLEAGKLNNIPSGPRLRPALPSAPPLPDSAVRDVVYRYCRTFLTQLMDRLRELLNEIEVEVGRADEEELPEYDETMSLLRRETEIFGDEVSKVLRALASQDVAESTLERFAQTLSALETQFIQARNARPAPRVKIEVAPASHHLPNLPAVVDPTAPDAKTKADETIPKVIAWLNQAEEKLQRARIAESDHPPLTIYRELLVRIGVVKEDIEYVRNGLEKSEVPMELRRYQVEMLGGIRDLANALLDPKGRLFEMPESARKAVLDVLSQWPMESGTDKELKTYVRLDAAQATPTIYEKLRDHLPPNLREECARRVLKPLEFAVTRYRMAEGVHDPKDRTKRLTRTIVSVSSIARTLALKAVNSTTRK